VTVGIKVGTDVGFLVGILDGEEVGTNDGFVGIADGELVTIMTGPLLFVVTTAFRVALAPGVFLPLVLIVVVA
jgi:hypothetical protein